MSQQPSTFCPECETWLRVDNFNGMAYCPGNGCDRQGNYLTQEEVQRIRDDENERSNP